MTFGPDPSAFFEQHFIFWLFSRKAWPVISTSLPPRSGKERRLPPASFHTPAAAPVPCARTPLRPITRHSTGFSEPGAARTGFPLTGHGAPSRKSVPGGQESLGESRSSCPSTFASSNLLAICLIFCAHELKSRLKYQAKHQDLHSTAAPRKQLRGIQQR